MIGEEECKGEQKSMDDLGKAGKLMEIYPSDLPRLSTLLANFSNPDCQSLLG